MAKPNQRPHKAARTESTAPDPVASRPDPKTMRTYAGALLFLFASLLYANTLGHGYTQDDAIVITENMFTTQGVKGIPGILQYDTFYGFFKEAGKAKLVAGGRYRPFSLLTFALETEFFGQSPFIGHLVNILLFGACCLLFFYAFLRLFPPDRWGQNALYAAFAAGLIFAAHPIHVEAVANIKGRDEILSLLGSLGALYLALTAFRNKNYLLHVPGALSLFAALLSKENAITYVALLPLALWFVGQRSMGKISLSLLPYLGAAVVFLAIRGSILGWSTGAPPMEFMNNPYLKLVGGQFVAFSPLEKFATALYALGRYLQLLFFPIALTHDYYPRHIDLMSLGDVRVWISGLAYLGLMGFGLYGIKRHTPLGLAVWFYLIPLSIVSNLVFPIGTHLAERLAFMPSIGFAMALGLLFFPLQKPAGSAGKVRLAVLGVAVLLLSIRTLARNPVWKDNFTLFTTDIQTSPNSAKLRNAVAGSLVDRSREEKDSLVQIRLLREAAGHAQRATELHPFYANAFLIQGNAHFYLKEYEQAITAYRKALQVSPGYKEALENLPLALRDAGRYAGEVRGDLPAAIALLEEADRLRPNDYEILRLLGIAHGMSQIHQEAIRYFTRAAELNPKLPDAWTNLSTAYFASGNAAKGQEFLQKAQGLK